MLVALLVIRLSSVDLWGSVVTVIIIMDLAFAVINWGNRPYLIREFGLTPHQASARWRESVVYRIGLVLLFCGVIMVLNYPLELKIGLWTWTLGRFIYQSFEAVIQFNRDFAFSILQEVLALLIVLVPIWIQQDYLDLQLIILLFGLSAVAKGAISLVFYRKFIWKHSSADPKRNLNRASAYFKVSLPFFFLTLTGMLQSRMDLYVVALFLGNYQLGIYQVLIGFLGFAQFIASQILIPFGPQLMRLGAATMSRLNRNYILWGVPITGVCLGVIHLVLTWFYQIELSGEAYIWSFFYVFLYYLYALKHYELARQNKQNISARNALFGSTVNLLLSLWLTPWLGLEGALMAVVGSKAMLAVIYNVSFDRR